RSHSYRWNTVESGQLSTRRFQSAEEICATSDTTPMRRSIELSENAFGYAGEKRPNLALARALRCQSPFTQLRNSLVSSADARSRRYRSGSRATNPPCATTALVNPASRTIRVVSVEKSRGRPLG